MLFVVIGCHADEDSRRSQRIGDDKKRDKRADKKFEHISLQATDVAIPQHKVGFEGVKEAGCQAALICPSERQIVSDRFRADITQNLPGNRKTTRRWLVSH